VAVLAVADWVIVIGSAVAGIGAAMGAAAAWKAAAARSGAVGAAREARNAMALAAQPHVEVAVRQWGESGALSARALVTSARADAGTRAAADVLIQFRLASGKEGSRSVPLLVGAGDPRLPMHPPYLEVLIAEPSDDWPPPEGDRLEITVLFSDMHKTAAFKLSMAANLRRVSTDPDAVSIQITEPPATTRIDRPGLLGS
jgi:hypothetical protein